MHRLAERLIQQFQEWEFLGRGDLPLCDDFVTPEPPYQSFPGYGGWDARDFDDGRRPSSFERFLGVASAQASPPEEPESSPISFRLAEEASRIELQAHLPKGYKPDEKAFSSFLLTLSSCAHPISFEIIGREDTIVIQWNVAEVDAPLLQQQAEGWFPEAFFSTQENVLAKALADERTPSVAVAECRLANLCHFPITTSQGELLQGLLVAMSHLEPGEMGLLQVIFEPAQHPWGRDLLDTVISDGQPFFADGEALARAAQSKVSKPLYGVAIRFAATAKDSGRLEALFRQLTAPLSLTVSPHGNEVELFFEEEGDYPDLLSLAKRTTNRFGMLLNLEELMQFVSFPATAHLSKLVDSEIRSRPAPSIPPADATIELGTVSHRGEEVTVRYNAEQRVRHTHIIGASGTGKSTLLLNSIRQDMENGQGCCLMDPHGDLVDEVLKWVPEHRIDDVILFDPSDEEFPIGFNVLSAHSEVEKTLLASDLCSVFRRFSTSWGDQMTAVLSNAILAFLESSRGGTLADLRKFLVDSFYRTEFLKTVDDPEVVYFWTKDYRFLSGKPEGSVVMRLNSFLRPKPIRNMVSQRESKLDFAKVMDEEKILLARIPQGLIGEENAYLLGSLLVIKIHQLILGRQARKADSRRHFWLYIDECQNFVTDSMASILSGARKYNLGLTLVHQEMRQLENRDRDVASALLANAHNRFVFRVGDHDARTLEGGFGHYGNEDMQKLATGQALGRIGGAENDFCLSVPWAQPPGDISQIRADQIIDRSRSRYGVPIDELTSEPSTTVEEQEEERTRDSQTEHTVVEPTEEQAPPERPAPETPKPLPTEKAEISKKQIAVSHDEKLPGRGGREHKAIQGLVKQLANTFDYRASIEKALPDGRSVDVLLEKGEEMIAVEISITTPLEYELKNIGKCLELGAQHVVWLAPDEKKRQRMKGLIKSEIPRGSKKKIVVIPPDEFQKWLEEISRNKTRIETSRGYTVNVSFVSGNESGREERKKQIGKTLANASKRIRQ